QGLPRDEVLLEVAVNAARALGVTEALVPWTFPIRFSDRLRETGVTLIPELDFFQDRRRVKSDPELAGIRRAQSAAEAGMEAARALLRRAEPNGAGLVVDGEPLTSEGIKAAILEAFTQRGTVADEFIVAHGPQSAVGHDMGSGQIAAGEPIVIDV